MKTGIIGLPQVGKTSLFKILTRAKVETPAYSNPREAHLGVAKVPDDRLDKLAALYNPKRIVYATVEYADVAAIGQEALKQMDRAGEYPDVVIGCVGGGSNFAGLTYPFIGDKLKGRNPKTRFIAAEPAACPTPHVGCLTRRGPPRPASTRRLRHCERPRPASAPTTPLRAAVG